MDVLGWIFLGAGIFSMTAAAADWDWFLNHRKARVFVFLLGRTGARVLYFLLGAFLLGLGVATLLGKITWEF